MPSTDGIWEDAVINYYSFQIKALRWTPWLPGILVRLPDYPMTILEPQSPIQAGVVGSSSLGQEKWYWCMDHEADLGYGQDSTPGVLDPKPLLFHSIALDLDKSIPWELGCIPDQRVGGKKEWELGKSNVPQLEIGEIRESPKISSWIFRMMVGMMCKCPGGWRDPGHQRDLGHQRDWMISHKNLNSQIFNEFRCAARTGQIALCGFSSPFSYFPSSCTFYSENSHFCHSQLGLKMRGGGIN